MAAAPSRRVTTASSTPGGGRFRRAIRLAEAGDVQHLLPKPLEPAALLWALAQDQHAPDSRPQGA